MIAITTLDGTVIDADDDAVTFVAGPRPHDPPDRTYVGGVAPTDVVTAESARSFLGRLHPSVPLQQFTRPNDTPVWIRCASVISVRPPRPDDIPPGETVGAVIDLGSRHQAVAEPVATVRQVVNAHGGHV